MPLLPPVAAQPRIDALGSGRRASEIFTAGQGGWFHCPVDNRAAGVDYVDDYIDDYLADWIADTLAVKAK